MVHTENATLKCLSTIRNQLFCACKLPSQPPEVNRVEPDHLKELETEKKINTLMSPGIVARLMGLDSMPDENWVPKDTTLDSVGRSRSANSIGHWSEFDPVKGFHRRVKTSLSFRDVEYNEFLFIRSESVHQRNMSRLKERKTSREVKQRGVQRENVVLQKKEQQVRCRRVNKENDSRGKLVQVRPTRDKTTKQHSFSVHSNDPKILVRSARGKVPAELANHPREVANRGKFTKKSRVKPECSLENSLVRPRNNLPVKEISRKKISNSRRKQPLEILISRSSSTNSNCCGRQSAKKEGKISNQCTAAKVSGYMNDVGKLAIEYSESSFWKERERWNLEEIGVELELRVVDQLVHEIVAELSGFPVESLGYLMMDDYK